MGIFRKSPKVSAFNFDPKKVKKGVLCDTAYTSPTPLILIVLTYYYELNDIYIYMATLCNALK